MALFLAEEGGHDPYLSLYAKVNVELMKMKEIGIEKVQWVCVDRCDACKKNEGKIFKIDDALKTMPIPHKECTNKFNICDSFCQCLWIYHAE